MVWTGSALPVTGCQKKTNKAEDRSDSSSHLTIWSTRFVLQLPLHGRLRTTVRADIAATATTTAARALQTSVWSGNTARKVTNSQGRVERKASCHAVDNEHDESHQDSNEKNVWLANDSRRDTLPLSVHARQSPNRCESCTDAARGSVIQTRHLLEEEDEERARPESDIVQCDVACGVVVACWRSGE